jgi:hypothetical protein
METRGILRGVTDECLRVLPFFVFASVSDKPSLRMVELGLAG